MHAVTELHQHALSIRRFPPLAIDEHFGIHWLDADGHGAKSITSRLDLDAVGIAITGIHRRVASWRRPLRLRTRRRRWSWFGCLSRRQRLHRLLVLVRLPRTKQHALAVGPIPRLVNRYVVFAERHVHPLERAVEVVHRANEVSVDVDLRGPRGDLHTKVSRGIPVSVALVRIRIWAVSGEIRVAVEASVESPVPPPERVVEVRRAIERVAVAHADADAYRNTAMAVPPVPLGCSLDQIGRA